jgi:putative RecB family exonuclease
LARCAKAYFLSRIAKAPARPALWLAGGSAVHEVTEKYDRMAVNCTEQAFHVGGVWERYFECQLAELREKEPNENTWRWSKTEPIPAWNQMGPEFVRSYIAWRKRSPWEIWTTPDGQPAIELDVSGRLPGCPVEIKGFVDRVFHDPVFDRLVVLDLKTGKRPPKTADQFGTYRALLEVKYGIKCDLGVAFMNRQATVGKPFELAEYTPTYVGKVFAEAWEQIERGDFPANGFPNDCFICDMSASCHMKNGPLAHLYDPDSPGYPIPF